MKFTLAMLASLLLADQAQGFVSPPQQQAPFRQQRSSARFAVDLPVVQQNSYGAPADVRYSDFVKLVNGDRIEKVTFSADGTQLLGVDVDGVRVKLEALPNDPELLTQLTSHKVRTSVWVLGGVCVVW
jgi:cell division protease FtsH